MAGAEPSATVTTKSARSKLIAVDGVDGAAVIAAAKAALAAVSGTRGGLSRWDASGIFQDLAVAAEDAGTPSPRTLLLLYAADLAFRLRWQVRPALVEGRTVVVAPYVDTAIAFGRAAGLRATWLENLFRFAPRPSERHVVAARDASAAAVKDGFVAVACGRLSGDAAQLRQRLIRLTAANLRPGLKRGRTQRGPA
jgi:hypothetical protein